MLGDFFDQQHAEENALLFKDLNIARSPKHMAHQGKYPVVSVTFKGINGSDFKEAYTHLCPFSAKKGLKKAKFGILKNKILIFQIVNF
jgi:hypothetical protein